MAISSMTSSKDLLYTLAPELRNEIYGYVFFDFGDRINISIRQTKHYLALLRTCKQYHQEAASFFYTKSVFHFSSSTIRLAHQVPLSTVLSPISDRYVHLLKRVTLYISVGDSSLSDTQASANIISVLMRVGAQFEEVCINLTLGQYLELSLTKILDDGILDSNHCIISALRSLLRSNICKKLQINIRGCYFASGVASCLFETFKNVIGLAKDREIVFRKGNERLSEDLSACERKLTGNSYHSLFQTSYLRDGDDEAGDDEANESSKSSNMGTFPEILDLNLDHDINLGMDEDEDEDEYEAVETNATSSEAEGDEIDDPNADIDFDWQAIFRQKDTIGFQNLVLFAPHLL
jgi:hypothetical protein